MNMKTRMNASTKYFSTMYKRLEVSRKWQHALTGEGSSGRSWIFLAIIRFSRIAYAAWKEG